MRGKKIISLLISISLILSISTFSVGFAEEVTTNEYASPYELEVEFLKSLKILDGGFLPSQSATKAELAKMVVSMMHPDLDFSTMGDFKDPAFNDVPADHKYYSYIKVCKDLKIVSGDTDGNFLPDKLVNLTDTLTVVLNAVGYTLYANALGGYPTGYYSIANSAGILDGIKVTADAITADVIAKVIYNTLFADISGIESISENGITIKIDSDRNLLSDRFGITEYDAQVIDSGVSSLDGASIDDPERAVIEDIKTGKKVTAYVNESNIASYLGYRVKVFIRNNETEARNEIVYVKPHKKVNSMVLNACDIINTTSDYVEYQDDEESLTYKKVEFGGARPILIYNGIRLKENNLEEVMPKDGIITFIDNDGNKKYDIVNVLSFNYANIGETDSNSNGIKDKFEQPAWNIVTSSTVIDAGLESISDVYNPANFLDLNDKEYAYAFTPFSDKFVLRGIATYDIVSVAQSPKLINGKTFYFLTVKSANVKGTVDSIINNEKIEVAGSAYDLSSSLLAVKPNYMDNIAIGESVTLHLDYMGNVAYIVFANGIAKNYAYLTTAGIKSGAEDRVQVRMFTKTGIFGTFELAAKTVIDGVAYTTPQTQLDALRSKDNMTGARELYPSTNISRPVIYKTDTKGVITMIDTDNPNTAVADSAGANDFYESLTYIKYSDEEVDDKDALKAGYRSLKMTDYTNNGTMDGKFYIAANSVIMNVPDIDRAGLKMYEQLGPGHGIPNTTNSSLFTEKLIEVHEAAKIDSNYKILSTGGLKASYRYDLQGYDIDPVTGVAGLVIVRGRMDIHDNVGIDYGAKNPMYVFLRKTQVYDATKGKSVTKLYYTQNGTDIKTVLVDMDECYYIYKFLIEGAAANHPDNLWEIAVNPIAAGDIIRVFVKADGYLDHLERVVEVRKNLTTNYSCFEYPEYPTSYPYSKSNPAKFPFDGANNSISPSQNPTIMLAPVKQISGTTVQFLIPKNLNVAANRTLAAMNLSNPTTYQVQFQTISGPALTPVTVVTFNNDGTVKVRMGTSADITTLAQTNNSYKGASIVIMKHADFAIQQTIVINNLEAVNNDAVYD